MSKSILNLGLEVQRDPYRYLLTNHEKDAAKCPHHRAIFGVSMLTLTKIYYLSRTNELARFKALRITPDMIFGLVWRSLVVLAITDQFGRRMFVNYAALREDKMANNECRKIMRTFPNAKPHLLPHQQPNNYFWC